MYSTFVHMQLYSPTAQCSPLPEIANGTISYSPDNTPDYNIGTVVTYNCNQGYVLVRDPGSVTRTCVDAGDGRGATFTGQAPTCERKQGSACTVNSFICSFILPIAQCPPLPEIANGMISYSPDNTSDYSVGTLATYSCNPGYVLVINPGSEMRNCVDAGDGSGGIFIRQAPTCERKQGNACTVHLFMPGYYFTMELLRSMVSCLQPSALYLLNLLMEL